MTDSTDELLVQRATTHGEYMDNAQTEQDLCDVYARGRKWETMPPAMRVSLRMNAHKIARAINGDPFNPEHWDDIAGYARLVADRLRDGRLRPVAHPAWLAAMDRGARVVDARTPTWRAGTLDGSGTLRIGGDRVGVNWEDGSSTTEKIADLRIGTPGALSPAQETMARDILQEHNLYRYWRIACDERRTVLHVHSGRQGRLTGELKWEGGVLKLQVARDDQTEWIAEKWLEVEGDPVRVPGTPEDGGHHDGQIVNPTPEKQPIRATLFEYNMMQGVEVRTGTMAGKQWRLLYTDVPDAADSRYVMIDAYQEEYGQ